MNSTTNKQTVHLFDACLGTNLRDPIKNSSKVVIFTSPYFNSCQQFQRIGAAVVFVPSYSREEMDKRRASFPLITDEIYQQKLELCGHGSIRLVLGLSMEQTNSLLQVAIQRTTLSNMLDIVRGKAVDVVPGIKGPFSLFTATLDGHPCHWWPASRDAIKTDMDSYDSHNVSWNISSSHIMRLLVARCYDEAMRFAASAASVFQQTPGSEVTAGLFFEAVAPWLLAAGGEFKVRKLDGTGTEIEEVWPRLTVEVATHINQLSEALLHCTNSSYMFLFLAGGKMVGIDAFHPLTKYLQCTQKSSHLIHLKSMAAICKQLPLETKLRLYFVVPAQRFDEGWRDAQSFAGPSEIHQNASSKLQRMDGEEIQSTMMDVSKSDWDLVQTKLEQYAVRVDLNKHPLNKPKSPATFEFLFSANNQARRFSTKSSMSSACSVSGSHAVIKILRCAVL